MVAAFDGSRPSLTGWPWTRSSSPATSTPKPRGDEGIGQRWRRGGQERPSRRTRPWPARPARPRPGGKGPRRPNGTMLKAARIEQRYLPGSRRATCSGWGWPRSWRNAVAGRPGRRARRPRTSTAWKLLAIVQIAWAAHPGLCLAESAYRRPRPTSSSRTWRSVRPRPSPCGPLPEAPEERSELRQDPVAGAPGQRGKAEAGQRGDDTAEAGSPARHWRAAVAISSRVRATKFHHIRMGSSNGSPPRSRTRAGSVADSSTWSRPRPR